MNIELEFIQGIKGQYLLTRWPAAEPKAPLLILLQPFAEEQNRLRRVFRQLAVQLQHHGWEVWLPDLYGTGDSDGEFEHIDFCLWQQDLARLISEQIKGERLYCLLACRFAALQLIDLVANYNVPQPSKFILWQPVLDVNIFWQQLWRQFQASEMMYKREKVSFLDRLNSEQKIDLAGYQITAHFYHQVLSFVPDFNVLASSPLLWLESSVQSTPSIAAQKLWQQLPNNNIRRRLTTVDTPLYWLSQEAVDTDLLIKNTLEFLREPMDD